MPAHNCLRKRFRASAHPPRSAPRSRRPSCGSRSSRRGFSCRRTCGSAGRVSDTMHHSDDRPCVPRNNPRSCRTKSNSIVAGPGRQQCRCRKALGLDPEILVAVTDRAVRGKAVADATMLVIPRPLERGIEQALGGRQPPRRGAMALQDQQQLGPLGLMAGLEAPGAEQVLGIVLVVVPVDLPARVVMLPDQPISLRSEIDGHALGQTVGPVQVFGVVGWPRRPRAWPRSCACWRSGHGRARQSASRH